MMTTSNKRKKGIVMAVAMAFVSVLFTGCDEPADGDGTYAYVEISTANGQATVENAFHGNNSSTGQRRQVYAVKDPAKMVVQSGEAYTVKFVCPDCGYHEEYNGTGPYSHLFSCECNGDYGEGPMKEFISVEIEVATEK